jgi:hypothetical protein
MKKPAPAPFTAARPSTRQKDAPAAIDVLLTESLRGPSNKGRSLTKKDIEAANRGSVV